MEWWGRKGGGTKGGWKKGVKGKRGEEKRGELREQDREKMRDQNWQLYRRLTVSSTYTYSGSSLTSSFTSAFAESILEDGLIFYQCRIFCKKYILYI